MTVKHHSNPFSRAACEKMTAALVLRIQEIFIITLQLLLLLPLPLLLQASPCPAIVEEMVVSTTLEADNLAEALLCDGPAMLAVSWHGAVTLSRTLFVSNGSTLNVTVSSERTDGADTEGAAVISDDTNLLLFDVGLGSALSMIGLTFSGGDGALRVTGESSIEVIDCIFTHNNRNSSVGRGELADCASFLLYMPPRTRDHLQ